MKNDSFCKCQETDNRKDDINLHVLKKVLIQSDIPAQYYSLNGFCEEAICIELSGEYWSVYHGERGNKYEIERYANLNDACIEMLKRLSPDSKTENLIIKQYNDYCNKLTISDVYFTEIEKAKNYLHAQKFFAASNTNKDNISDADIIKIANEIYKSKIER